VDLCRVTRSECGLVIEWQSANFVASDEEGEALAKVLWEKISLSGASGERKAEVVLLKNAVLLGGEEKKEEAKMKGDGLGSLMQDPMLKRRGAASAAGAYGTNVVNDEPDVHSKAAQARARADAKAEEKRRKAAEEQTREHLAMEAELARRRRETARARIDGNAGGSVSVIESESFELPNPGGGENLLEDVTLRLVAGHRYGLIGRNGKGKSTLLRWMASGRVKGLPPHLSMHYVAQELPLAVINEDVRPVDMVLRADVERELLLEDLARLEEESAEAEAAGKSDAIGAAEKMAETLERLQVIDADGAEGRARAMLVALGFSEELLERPMKALSGGWRVRVALASALFASPDVLMLDEPTNHLAIDGVLWLQRTLATSSVWKSRIVVVVSHDRTFTDAVCSDMLHISGTARRLTLHRGNYEAFEAKRKEMQEAYAKSSELREQRRAKLLEYTRRQGKAYTFQGTIAAKMQRVKQIEKSDAEAAEEAEELAYLEEDEERELKLNGGGALQLPVARFRDVGFGYPSGKNLFSHVEMCVDGASRICLLGENGAGKTTLVKLLMGLLEPTQGVVERDGGARIALVNQHHADQIDLNLTPLHWMHSQFPGDGSYQHEQDLIASLAQCGVPFKQQTTRASNLSGGQRSRVAFAAVSYRRPHVLILDEPTNNLDLESVEALSQAVEAFPGGVVLVSHDQTFVSAVAKEVWVVGGGQVRRAESFNAYRKSILKSFKD